MKNIDERKLLPIIRDAVRGQECDQQQFIAAILPQFEGFCVSGLDSDNWEGWCFNLSFFNVAMAGQGPFRDALLFTSSDWVFFPDGKDDCTYVIPGKGLIKIHLHGFLWNYGV